MTAVSTNTQGIHYVYGSQLSDNRMLERHTLDMGNPVYGGQEVMIVFVLNDRAFVNGEVDFSGILVERFASYHRLLNGVAFQCAHRF